MRCFLQKDVKNSRFPVLSDAVYRLKNDPKGVSAVCKVMRRYEAIAKTEGRAEGRAEGREEGRAEGMSQLANAIQELKAGASKDELLKKYDEQTVNLAIACR